MSPASLTYSILNERFMQQDRERQQAALVDALQSRRMRPEFRAVFDRFAEWEIAIVGSSSTTRMWLMNRLASTLPRP